MTETKKTQTNRTDWKALNRMLSYCAEILQRTPEVEVVALIYRGETKSYSEYSVHQGSTLLDLIPPIEISTETTIPRQQPAPNTFNPKSCGLLNRLKQYFWRGELK